MTRSMMYKGNEDLFHPLYNDIIQNLPTKPPFACLPDVCFDRHQMGDHLGTPRRHMMTSILFHFQ